ncbi:type II toxin-antitoxin system VapC family toxin [Microbacterium sp.]|uniref:type II toxin-antitoxin system VapC family toxin n=1 Tax=Microbacterium sp. TaxID=51671 RepID=UPI0039E67A4A
MIYVDACLLSNAMEDEGELGRRTRALLSRRDEVFTISPLVMLEALVLPLRADAAERRVKQESLFAEFVVLGIDDAAYLLAAEVRAASPGLKTVDALHVAIAQLGGCAALWTNDQRLATASAGFAVNVIGAR